jgi:hypothetical protein
MRNGLGVTVLSEPAMPVLWAPVPSGTTGQQRYIIDNTSVRLRNTETPPIIGREALVALVRWLARRTQHDPLRRIHDLAGRARSPAAAPDRPAGPDGDAASGDRHQQEGEGL